MDLQEAKEYIEDAATRWRNQRVEQGLQPESNLGSNDGKRAARSSSFTGTIHSNGHPMLFDAIRVVLNDHNWRDSKGIRYIICGLETAPTTGRAHIQYLVQFATHRTASAAQKGLGIPWANIDIARDPHKCREYCLKEGNSFEVGDIVSQGKRSDIHDLVCAIKEAKSFKEVVEAHTAPVLRMVNGARSVFNILHPPRERPFPKVFVATGPPGTGKSAAVYNKIWELQQCGDIKGEVAVIGDNKEGWMDGYDGEQGIYFEDFEGAWPLSQMLKLIDIYPYRMMIKGGTVVINANYFFFTSNIPLEEMYQGLANQHRHDAWRRRIDPTWPQPPGSGWQIVVLSTLTAKQMEEWNQKKKILEQKKNNPTPPSSPQVIPMTPQAMSWEENENARINRYEAAIDAMDRSYQQEEEEDLDPCQPEEQGSIDLQSNSVIGTPPNKQDLRNAPTQPNIPKQMSRALFQQLQEEAIRDKIDESRQAKRKAIMITIDDSDEESDLDVQWATERPKLKKSKFIDDECLFEE